MVELVLTELEALTVAGIGGIDEDHRAAPGSVREPGAVKDATVPFVLQQVTATVTRGCLLPEPLR
ncbi:hypothetical protein ACPOLB_25835 [Rubrivivax sp. RP6-9]|uniref:hypothetical protein n=1 Tax=Rubrivivax sp. RP6-9 TaxID=3415750 RepID=UPI003CC67141